MARSRDRGLQPLPRRLHSRSLRPPHSDTKSGSALQAIHTTERTSSSLYRGEQKIGDRNDSIGDKLMHRDNKIKKLKNNN